MSKRALLLTSFEGETLARLCAIYSEFELIVVRSLAELRAASATPARLLSFGSGVIVPADLLAQMEFAYNLHGASPDFPGRDPHHHAIYRGARRYGATLHHMTASVDAGPIVAVDYFDIAESATPARLLAEANETGLQLLERIGPQLLREPLAPEPGAVWGAHKTRREDLARLGDISPLLGEDEFARRVKALASDTHDNVRLALYGRRFRLTDEAAEGDDSAFAEFTEDGFAALLDALTARGYRFAVYTEATNERHVLWRHDIDISLHRAVRLAEIEQERGIRATYFVNPRSTFYNLMEPEAGALLGAISERGHDIGLHFEGAPNGERWTRARLESAVASEKRLLEDVIGKATTCLSWHNPSESNLLDFGDDTICGAVNAYSSRLRERYVYCSDSNGYWRHKPMQQVIAAGDERLHLLTHPEWWTPTAMDPDARVDRAILGRARSTREAYDTLLERSQRRPR